MNMGAMKAYAHIHSFADLRAIESFFSKIPPHRCTN